MPYIKDTSETIARILQPYDIRVAHKPITTLRHILTNVKDKDQPHDRQGAVYRIKCTDCQATYIGETGNKPEDKTDWTQTKDQEQWYKESYFWAPSTNYKHKIENNSNNNWPITTKLTYQNQDRRHKYHHLTTTLHLTLKRTTAHFEEVEKSVTNNSLSKDYLHPDDRAKK